MNASVGLQALLVPPLSLPDTPVLSFFEVPEEKQVEVVAVIGAQQPVLA